MTRLRTLLLAAAAVAIGITAVATPAGAATSTSHPYSDPVWFPLHAPALIGCLGSSNNHNPDSTGTCAKDHVSYYGMILDIKDHSNAGVYASGAGTVSSVVTGVGCGGRGSAGNLVAVNNGGGYVSYYEHLKSVSVRTGQYVSAGQQLGTAGNSGAPCSAGAYIDFVVRTDGGGYLNRSQLVNSLKACVSGKTQSWPSALNRSYTSWLKVPRFDLVTPTAGTGCGQTTVPASYAQPGPSKVTAGTRSVTIAWGATAADYTMVQIEVYHPSTKSWGNICSPTTSSSCSVGFFKVTGPRATSYTVSGLTSRTLYRIHIARHNTAGWSLFNSFINVTAK